MRVCNVGKLDRIVRILVGIVLIGVVLYFVPTMVPKLLLLMVAISILASGWLGFCFLYKLLNISTAKPKA